MFRFCWNAVSTVSNSDAVTQALHSAGMPQLRARVVKRTAVMPKTKTLEPIRDYSNHRVFTIAEACEAARVSRMTLHRFMQDGRLPVIRHSPRCIRIKREELEKLGLV
jgi:excisionase family DNA binding protein